MIEISVINSNGKKVFDSSDCLNSVKKICKDEKIMKMVYTGTMVATQVIFSEAVAYAEPISDVAAKVKVAVNPIIELLASLGYPVTYGMIVVASLMIITGRKKIGIEMLKWAGIGYITLQFAPVLLQILDTIGTALRAGI